MSEVEYEFVPGSPEQVEIFLDLQRMLIKMYNRWPGDTAIAVFSAALGSAVALIETQYERHMEECDRCRETHGSDDFDLIGVARNNLEYYYVQGVNQAINDARVADDMVQTFFNKGKH